MQAHESSYVESDEAQDRPGEVAGTAPSLVRSRPNTASHSNDRKTSIAAPLPPNVLPHSMPPSAATAAAVQLQSSTADCDSGQTDLARTSLARSARSPRAGQVVAPRASAHLTRPSSLPRSGRISPSIAARLPSYEGGVLGAADPSGGCDGGQTSTSDPHASSAVDGWQSHLNAVDDAVPHQPRCALACTSPHLLFGFHGSRHSPSLLTSPCCSLP